MVSPESIGINLQSKKETEYFKWLIFCILRSRNQNNDECKITLNLLIEKGIDSAKKLANAKWDDLADVLVEARYIKQDYSIASKLIGVGFSLENRYGGVIGLLEQAADIEDIEDKLIAFELIGTKTAQRFARGVSTIWFGPHISNDYETASAVATILKRHGYESYFVGGAVRDLLLGKHPKDFDIATNARPQDILAIDEFEATKYNDPAVAYGVTRIKFIRKKKPLVVEVATFRVDKNAHLGRKKTAVEFSDLENDVLRRDFTVNAMAIDPETNSLIDYESGLRDLEARLIRFIGNADMRIAEDPLRLMRAIRFKNQLSFEYDKTTKSAIFRAVKSGQIKNISADRMRDEMTKILSNKNAKLALIDMDEFGILDIILPEVVAGKGVAQPLELHQEGDVWNHQLIAVDSLPLDASPRLVWATLLHDIGKPPTKSIDANGRIRFSKHYEVGAEMSKKIALRFNFSNKMTRDVAWMIHNHLAIDDLPSMTAGHATEFMSHPAFDDLLELHRVDAKATYKPDQAPKIEFRQIEKMWHDFQQTLPMRRQLSLKRDLGIDGDWLIENFGELPGPKIGSVLKILEQKYKYDNVNDRSKLSEIAKELIDKE